MNALITGGTGGIGFFMAKELLKKGYDVFLISRNIGRTDELIKEFPDRKVYFFSHDLSREDECYHLLLEINNIPFEVFVSNAGFGDIGKYEDTDIQKEISMVKLNDISTLILVKSFMERFKEQGRGRILVTCSAASFGVAPYMNVYYATKAFSYSLVHGYHRELRMEKSQVTISALCPGPVKTDFGKTANVKLSKNAMLPEKVAEVAVNGILKGKLEIVPGFKMKLVHFLSHLVPKRLISCFLNKSAEME